MKDNTYHLKRDIWNDVSEDWPFYTEEERQAFRRRKPQNLTPPGSDGSTASMASGHSSSSSHPASPQPTLKRPSASSSSYLVSAPFFYEINFKTKDFVKMIVVFGVWSCANVKHTFILTFSYSTKPTTYFCHLKIMAKKSNFPTRIIEKKSFYKPLLCIKLCNFWTEKPKPQIHTGFHFFPPQIIAGQWTSSFRPSPGGRIPS